MASKSVKETNTIVNAGANGDEGININVNKKINESLTDIFTISSDYVFKFTLHRYGQDDTVIISNEKVTPAKILNLVTTLDHREGVNYHVDKHSKMINVILNDLCVLNSAIYSTTNSVDVYEFLLLTIRKEEFKLKTYMEKIDDIITRTNADEYTKQEFRNVLKLFINNVF